MSSDKEDLDLEEELKKVKAQVEALQGEAVTTTTWGLFFVLVSIILLLITIFLALMAWSGGSITPALVVLALAVLALLIGLLEKWREQKMLEQLKPWRKKLEELLDKLK